ncbi:MAG TPA: AAA family ATPase [Acidimicrobiales bacterium]|nr:AAA family ATPase [Acidimicrobiales bacterium]
MPDGGGIVALLFTDLVGSTSMYDRLGDERAEELRRGHFAELRHALEAHGGQEVKNLGDGLMVAFGSALAAAEAAVAMQRAASAGGPGPEDRLAVRVGIHAGEPTVDGDDYFGVSVNIARRLCDVAAPGQILASDLIHALVSPRRRTGLRSVGALSLKGIEEPVVAYEVEWSAPPVKAEPAVLAVAGDAPFVGRHAELERLVLLWKRAVEGAPAVALVSGEPGIGKTRLVQELGRRATEGPCILLAGRSDAELTIPLELFAEAVREAAVTWPAALLTALSDPALEPLQRSGEAGASLPDTERATLFEGMTRLLATAESTAPVLLVLDDLHWADEASLLLLRHVLRAGHRRLMVVVTYRDTELSRTHPLASLIADLRRERGVERIALHGLGVGSIEALLGGPEASNAIAELADRIAEETEGNAFFVTEVIRNLVELGYLAEGDDGWEVVRPLDDVDVPQGIREVVGRRLTRLSPACNDMLAVAAVVGRQFSAAVVAAVAGLPFEEALDAIDEALEAHVVTEDRTTPGAFVFGHALVRETLYAELTTIRRLRLHLKVGESLRAAGAPLLEIAHHLLEAGPAGPVRDAGEAAVVAAKDARFRLAAFEDAAALSRRALALLTDEEPDLRCDLLTILGEVLLCVGDAAGRAALDEAVDIGRSLGDPFRIERALTFAIRAGMSAAETARYVEATQEALQLLPEDAIDARSRLRAVLALGRLVDPSELPGVLADAIATGDREAVGYATLALADAQLIANDPSAARSTLDQTIALMQGSFDEATLVYDERYFEIALVLGDRSGAEHVADRIREGSQRLHLPTWDDTTMRASLAVIDGRLDDAETHLQSVYARRESADFAGPLLATLALERDQCASFLPFLEGQVGETGDAGWNAAMALFLSESGRRDEARPKLRAALEGLTPNVGWPLTIGVLSEAASDLEDTDVAAEARVYLEPLRGLTLTAVNVCLGAVERFLGRCALTAGDIEEAAVLLEDALARNRALGATLWVAHVEVDLAMALRSRGGSGDGDRADDLLASAASTAERLGLPRVARRAGAAHGGRLRAFD